MFYNISNCTFNPKYMKQQEDLLKHASPCAIIVADNIMASIIKTYIKHFKQPRKNVKIFTSPKDGILWMSEVSIGNK
jgi:predicted O-methyltransferase YrrM